MNICKRAVKLQEQTLYLMIIAKLLLASKGISVLLGFDDCTYFASKHREKCEQQREFGTDYHRPIQNQMQFPMVSVVQRGTEKQGEHTLVKALLDRIYVILHS